MLTVPVPDHVDFLVKRKFPELIQPLSIKARLMSNNGFLYDDSEDEWKEPSPALKVEAEKYRAELRSLPKQDIKKRFQEELAKQYRR